MIAYILCRPLLRPCIYRCNKIYHTFVYTMSILRPWKERWYNLDHSDHVRFRRKKWRGFDRVKESSMFSLWSHYNILARSPIVKRIQLLWIQFKFINKVTGNRMETNVGTHRILLVALQVDETNNCFVVWVFMPNILIKGVHLTNKKICFIESWLFSNEERYTYYKSKKAK